MSVEEEGLTIYVIDAEEDTREAVPFTVTYNPQWGVVDVHYDNKHLFSTDWQENMIQLFRRSMEIWPIQSSEQKVKTDG